MIEPEQRPILRGFVTGRTENRQVVNFADELAAARTAMRSIAPELDGMDVSKALRALGFNRAYEIDGRKPKMIVYRRAQA